MSSIEFCWLVVVQTIFALIINTKFKDMLQICIFSNMHHSWAINANTTKLEMLMMFFYGFKKEILLCFAAGLFTANIQDQFAIMSHILVYRLQPRDRSLTSYLQCIGLL